MSSVNRVTLIGRMGKDPEYKTLQSGKGVCNFSIATSEKYKTAGGESKETTTWHNLILWEKLADIAVKYLHKGDLIYVEGKITNRSWEKDGITRNVTEIVVRELTMLSTKRPEQSAAPSPSTGQFDDPTDFSPGPPFKQDPLGPNSGGGSASSKPQVLPIDDLPFKYDPSLFKVSI